MTVDPEEAARVKTHRERMTRESLQHVEDALHSLDYLAQHLPVAFDGVLGPDHAQVYCSLTEIHGHLVFARDELQGVLPRGDQEETVAPSTESAGPTPASPPPQQSPPPGWLRGLLEQALTAPPEEDPSCAG